ncbi:MAG: tetratricopeptide repeat protein [Erythrobacter sp.]|nr:tetratricopeptide repeat protein [Erythrobacter sp.]
MLASLGVLLATTSASALAGDEVLYEPAPDWIQPVDLSTVERDPSNNLVVQDRQIRIEDGRLWEYTDTVYRLSSLQELGQVGTLTAQWLPDKGDLIVHEIAILRDDEKIDVIEQGERMEILRRERLLEMRIIDGSLTATMSVPGLQVGDELRMRYSVTNSDQALGREVQSQAMLWREPSKIADFNRVLASWPDEIDVRWQAGPDFDPGQPEQRDGHNWISITLPLPEAEDYPYDAPARFRRPTLLQLGTFDGWGEVSSVMAPYYEVDGALEGLDDLIEKVDAIRKSEGTELEQAVAALELVQEDVRYLLNGLDGGNYLPQDVATTWEKRYGDCKAKTVILLAILADLGIEAEAVLVSTNRGETVPTSLPLPGAFNHVLVRATVDGQMYYLDGTSLGANIDVVGNVPPFYYALPIRAEGAELEEIVQEAPLVADMGIELIMDASVGADLPMLGTMKMKMIGPRAAQMNANADKITDDNKQRMGGGFRRLAGGSVSVLDVKVEPGEDDSEATLVIDAVFPPLLEFEGTTGEFKPPLPSSSFEFSPDRSRKAWRDLPASVRPPGTSTAAYRITLPETSEAFEIRGETQLDLTVARQRFKRDIRLADSELVIFEEQTSLGGEVPAEEFRAERRKSSQLARSEVKIVAPDALPRRWRFAEGADRSALEPIDAAFGRLIEEDPEESRPYLNRANFRFQTYDFAGSLEDMNSAIEIEATARMYEERSYVHEQLLDFQSAKADLEEAYALDPSHDRAITLARMLTDLGDLAEARELLAEVDGDENVRRSLAYAMADVEAVEGNGAAGLALLADLLIDAPNNAEILNSKCWFMGTWEIGVSDAIPVCTKAVENSDNTAMALDSRALAYLRNGQLDEALADAEAALELNPEQTETLLLRGLILRELGSAKGETDIASAIARSPGMARKYRRWGFDF